MSETSFRQFVLDLAARTPTPGGGAAAAQSGAMGAAVLTMVVRFTLGKRDATAQEETLQDVERALSDCTERMLPMAERDMASFERVAAAYKLPKSSEDQKLVRSRAIQEALQGAMVVPEELVHHVRDALAAISRVKDVVGRNIGADLGAGVALCYAAARAADLMVRTNASYLADRDHARAVTARCDEVMREVEQYRKDLQDRAEALTR